MASTCVYNNYFPIPNSCKILFYNDGHELVPLDEMQYIDYDAMVNYCFEFADSKAFQYYYSVMKKSFDVTFKQLYTPNYTIPLFRSADQKDIKPFITAVYTTITDSTVLATITDALLAYGCLNYILHLIKLLKTKNNIHLYLSAGTKQITPMTLIKMFYSQPYTQLYVLKSNEKSNSYKKILIKNNYNPITSFYRIAIR
ncbi:hypothetical protein CYY_010226 [Polysphondylium violaceum]|uniref:Uncharacterized protein n=1 Tax=Polysphondylium violaceum TaxID=133409 RepID=A0A8J4PKH8_9MYCE|nr:hypothetical protein CYY_010226 [Polysphondylium violaceum]